MRLATFLLICVCLPDAAGLAAQDGLVTGQYIEERSNRVYGCPCEFSSEWADAGRTAILTWNIESGIYDGQNLRGLRLVAVLAADSSLSVSLADSRSTLFVDETAPLLQQRAGLAWLRARYAEVLGRVLGEHPAPIDFSFSGDAAAVSIRDVLTVQMRRADPARDAESWAFLLFGPLTKLTTLTLGVTLQDRYSGPDLNARWKREGSPISGYFGTFGL